MPHPDELTADDAVAEKPCSTGHMALLTDFHRDAKSPDRLSYRCKSCAKASYDRWYGKNSDVAKQRARAWVLANPDAMQVCRDNWEADHPEAKPIRNALRRQSVRDAFIEHISPLVVLERDDGVCGICESDVNSMDFHVDHIIPIARGGDHSYANVQVAHPLCNLQKGAHV